jgi:hypothetical protein
VQSRVAISIELSPLVQNEASVPHFELHNPQLVLPHGDLLRKSFLL